MLVCAASDATQVCIKIAKYNVVYNNVCNHCTLLLLPRGEVVVSAGDEEAIT